MDTINSISASDVQSSDPLSTIESRVKEASKVLKVAEDSFQSTLRCAFGLELNEEGLKLLDAQTTTEQIIIETLSNSYVFIGIAGKGGESIQLNAPLFKLKLLAVAAILKGRDPFAKKEEPIQTTTIVNNVTPIKDNTVGMDISTGKLIELSRSLKDPKQMKDRELLELYNEERDYEVGQEIHNRSKFQYVIVFLPGQEGKVKKEIDIELSLDLLKRSRRMVNPSIIKQGDNIVNVYRIPELDPEDQIFEICPICGEITCKNYCEHCGSDFSATGEDEKIFISLISKMDSFDKKSLSDRRAVLVSAGKGLADLKVTWPKVAREYDKLKLTGDLPKLKKIKTLPSSKPADPFNVSGNRSF